MTTFSEWASLEVYSPPAHVGTYNRRLLTDGDTEGRLSMVRGDLEPGGRAEAHFHVVSSQVTHILAGRCKVLVEDQVKELGPGDSVYIPVGKIHEVIVLGDQRLELVNVYVPPLAADDIHEPKDWSAEGASGD